MPIITIEKKNVRNPITKLKIKLHYAKHPNIPYGLSVLQDTNKKKRR